MVGVTGLEPAPSWSQTMRATICATPRNTNKNYIVFLTICQIKNITKKLRNGDKSLCPIITIVTKHIKWYNVNDK